MDEAERRAKLERLSERLRLVFIEGAEEESRRGVDRPLTEDELRRVLRRYPGDPVRQEVLWGVGLPIRDNLHYARYPL